VLAKISTVYIFPIYPASEKPIRGITSTKLIKEINKLNGNAYEIKKNEVMDLLPSIASSSDLILVQGAGTIADIARLIREYE
jgi:UDP-N-acetylmuramate--alanine ligase